MSISTEETRSPKSPPLVAAASVSSLFLGSLLLPTDEYDTSVVIFPGSNASPTYQMEARFGASAEIFQRGLRVGAVHSEWCDEEGSVTIPLSVIGNLRGQSVQGLVRFRLDETATIPVDVYLASVHRQTGTYVSYPALPFIGDKVYPDHHVQFLENTNFWPAVVSDETTETFVVVMNGYDEPFSLQVHLFSPDGVRYQSKQIKVSAHTVREISIAEHFSHLGTVHGYSLCVASQFKHISYVGLKEKKTGIVTCIDHTHNYQML